MDYIKQSNNLNSYINCLKNYKGNSLILEDFLAFIIKKANERSLEIVRSDSFLYIKNGHSPKAIFHINIEYNKEKEEFKISDNEKICFEGIGSSINLVGNLFVIYYLLANSKEDFDVLISSISIHDVDGRPRDELKKVLRSENVINLNLKQGETIANEFSALKLFLNQVRVKRFVPDYDYLSYRISLGGLSGGEAGHEIDKVKLNSIKLILSIIRKIKAVVDLDIISITGGSTYDYIPSEAYADFIIKSDYEGEIEKVFDLVKNEIIEKNLKYDPDMKIYLGKLDKIKLMPITNESFNHLASFVELIPNGTVFVNSLDDQLVSSSNLASVRSLKNYVNMILVVRSLSEESMKSMVDKTSLASQISSSILVEKYYIKKWSNPDSYLKDIFLKSYREIFDRDMRLINTQYSLYGSIMFSDLPVKIISLGVKYKKGDKVYTVSYEDLVNLISLLERALYNLN